MVISLSSLLPEGGGQRASIAPKEDKRGVEQVLPGIWSITMLLPFALRWVNAYLLEGNGEFCLIDAGLATPDAEAMMLEGWAEAGITPPDLSTMVLTHAHPDHIGLAGKFQQASGAPVLMFGPEGRQMVSIWTENEIQAVEAVSAYYISHGMLPAESLLEKASMLSV